jgi:hypothetical protein
MDLVDVWRTEPNHRSCYLAQVRSLAKPRLAGLAALSNAMRQQLKDLWVFQKKFVDIRECYLNRIRARDKWILEQTLDLQLLDIHKPDGKLDDTLRTIEAYIKIQQPRAWYTLNLNKLDLAHKILSQFSDPLEDQCQQAESELEYLMRLAHELEEEEERRDEEKQQYEMLIQRMKRLLGFLATLLEWLLNIFLHFCNFSEFPNKRRPLCTTMPWNIRPALLVLWGVCWMFFDPMSSSHQAEIQSSAEHDPLQNIIFGKCLS